MLPILVGTMASLSLSGCREQAHLRDGDFIPSAAAVTFEPFTGAPVVTFGWRDLTDAPEALDDIDEKYAGAMLGDIAGIAEGPNQDLYVLDRSWRKVVVFDSSGGLRSVIVGGYGEGPGEFRVPRALAVSPTGIVGVLDEAPHRISLFSQEGVFTSTITLEDGRSPLRLALDDTYAWVLHSVYYPEQYALTRYEVDSGRLVDTLGFVRDSPLSQFTAYGEPGAITVAPNGGLVWALPMSGLLRFIGPDTGTDTTVGHRVFPSATPFVRSRMVRGREIRVRTVPASVKGVAASSDTTVIHHIRRLQLSRDGQRGKLEFLLSILTNDGAHSRHFTFGDEENVLAAFAASRTGDAIYVAREEPYLRVEKYLIPAPGGS